MAIRNTTVLCGLFFMAVGSVYSGSAIGADEPAPADEVPQATVITGSDADDDAVLDMTDDVPASPDEAVTPPDDEEMAPVAEEAGDLDLPEGQQVEVGSFGQIDLHVKDLELSKVLQLLSIQSRRNIVASRQVSGTISADLYDVGFYEALDAILHTNGFGYREKGNFIYVYTQQEIEQMEQAQRQTATKVVRLNYITASDASAFVQPMLSGSGSISVSGEAAAGMQPSLSDAGANTYAHSEMLVLRDYPENIEQIEAVLTELDQRPKQVQIEATILQARLTEQNAFGVDFALFGNLDVGDFTQPLGSVDDLISGTGRGDQVFTQGQSVQMTPGQTAEGPASVKVGFLGNDAALFIRALDSVTDTTVLARPQMLVLNRQRAELLVGSKLGYLSTTATDTTTTQTVEFLDIGTQLTVRPFVSDDGFVRLELRPSVSDGETRLEGGFIIPDQTTQELTTNVMVRSGQTVVLGGLFKEDTGVARRQVPFLGDVPLVGHAFRGQDDNVSRSEVIFLIKPTVMKDEALVAGAERAKETIEYARIGAREGLLPWSRTKLTNSHLRRAYQHKREGELDKALWHTDMTLHLHPSNIEALRLKEQLTGQRMLIKDEGVLKDAMDSMIDEYAPETEEDYEDLQEQSEEEMSDEADADASNGSDRANGAADAQDAVEEEVVDFDFATEMYEAEQDAEQDVESDSEPVAEPSSLDADRPYYHDADMEAAMQALIQSEAQEGRDARNDEASADADQTK